MESRRGRPSWRIDPHLQSGSTSALQWPGTRRQPPPSLNTTQTNLCDTSEHLWINLVKLYKIHASCSLTNACHPNENVQVAGSSRHFHRSRPNMPPTTVEGWLDHNGPEEADGLPHRCRKIIKEWTTDDGAFVTCCADDGSKQTHRLVAMSSLSRRACYKCGNVGHYAEVCSSAERLCYNCKFRRSVHEAFLTNLLPQASNQVSINICQRLELRPFLRPESDRLIGHESNGCPLPRTTEAKQCYHCQGLGHVQADCPTLRLSGAGTSGRCYNCGQPGHLAVGFKGYKIGRT